MKPADIRTWLKAEPFIPFKLHMVGGQSYEVRHPEFLGSPPGTRGLSYFDRNAGAFRILDALHVQEIERAMPEDVDCPDPPPDSPAEVG